MTLGVDVKSRAAWRRARWTVLVFGVVALAGSCASLEGCAIKSCTSEYVVPEYVIRVRDASTGALICDATVSEGGTQASAYSKQGDCYYRAPIGTVGSTTTIHVERTGYVAVDQQLSNHYQTDSCGHALETPVTIKLQPSP
jgi:hypothetical protein